MASILSVILRITGTSSAGGALTGLNQGLELAQAGVQALNDTVGSFIRTGFAMNASLETTTLQFRTLMGNADEAEAHVKSLFTFAQETPFETQPIIEASKNLRVMGGDALDTEQNLTMVGDAAAATGGQINDLAFWTGRAYSAIQAGRPFGEAAQRLQELAVLSPQARTEMERLSESGASADQVWKVFTDDMGKFTGAMELQAGTWAGLTSTMNDSLDMLAARLTQPLFLRAEEDLQRFNAVLGDPETTAKAEALGSALGFLSDEAIKTAGTLAATAPAVQAVTTALDIFTPSAAEAAAAGDDVSDAFSRITENARRAGAAIEAAEPIYAQARDDWAELSHAADEAALSYRGVRDESMRAASAQAILTEQTEAARMALAAQAGDMFTRHPDLDMSVATGGDLRGIEAITNAREDAARAAEKAAREAAHAEKEAARDAERAQTAAAREAERANREAARATEREWTAAHEATADTATRAATTQVAAAQEATAAASASASLLPATIGAAFGQIADGAAGATIEMQFLNASLRRGQDELARLGEVAEHAGLIGQQQNIAGQLSDLDTQEQTLPLRRQLLPLEQQMDLLKLAREATTHKERQKQLDQDIADVQLKIDGIRTQIAVKQRAGQARALELERLAIPYQRQRLWLENDILDAKERQLRVQMALNEAQRTLAPGGIVRLPTYDLRGRPLTTVNVDMRGSTQYGMDDLNRQITDTVNSGLRSGTVRLVGR